MVVFAEVEFEQRVVLYNDVADLHARYVARLHLVVGIVSGLGNGQAEAFGVVALSLHEYLSVLEILREKSIVRYDEALKFYRPLPFSLEDEWKEQGVSILVFVEPFVVFLAEANVEHSKLKVRKGRGDG